MRIDHNNNADYSTGYITIYRRFNDVYHVMARQRGVQARRARLSDTRATTRRGRRTAPRTRNEPRRQDTGAGRAV